MSRRPADRYRHNPDVIETDLERELILLDPATQEMFSLNEMGRVVWRALVEHTAGDIVAMIVERHEVAAEQAGADVRALISGLVEAGLLIPADADRA